MENDDSATCMNHHSLFFQKGATNSTSSESHLPGI